MELSTLLVVPGFNFERETKMRKKGIVKVWFGWSLWLMAIVLGLMLLIAWYDLFGNEWIDLGLVFVVNKLLELDIRPLTLPNEMWQTGGAICCLAPIMLVVLLIIWDARPRFWLKCPNCKARGWILNQEQFGKPYKRGGFFSAKRQIRKRWNLCARCNHEYGHSEREVAYDDSGGF